jgi:hypothetical protein
MNYYHREDGEWAYFACLVCVIVLMLGYTIVCASRFSLTDDSVGEQRVL